MVVVVIIVVVVVVVVVKFYFPLRLLYKIINIISFFLLLLSLPSFLLILSLLLIMPRSFNSLGHSPRYFLGHPIFFLFLCSSPLTAHPYLIELPSVDSNNDCNNVKQLSTYFRSIKEPSKQA